MERKLWLLIPKEIKIRILYYSIKSPLNKNIINEIFDYLFKDTEFVLHLGAHKTATTFIQNIISKNTKINLENK